MKLDIQRAFNFHKVGALFEGDTQMTPWIPVEVWLLTFLQAIYLIDNHLEVERGKLGSYLYEITPIYTTQNRVKIIERVNISYGQYRGYMFHHQLPVDELDKLVTSLKSHTKEEDIVNFNYSYHLFEMSVTLATRLTAIANAKKERGDNWFSLDELETLGVAIDPALRDTYSHVIAEGADIKIIRDDDNTPRLQVFLMPNSLVRDETMEMYE